MADHSYHGQKEKIWKGTLCFAINCTAYHNKFFNEKGISFHRFPNKDKEPERHRLWIRNCRRTKVPGTRAVICSQHFQADMFDRTGQKTKLKSNAVPTIFKLPGYMKPKAKITRKTLSAKRALEEIETPIHSFPDISPNNEDNIREDHSYSTSEEQLKKRVKLLENRVEDLGKKCRNTKLREKRAKNRMRGYLEQLKENNLVTAELEEKLSSYKDIPEDLFTCTSEGYSEKQKQFSLTLHLYSPKAYTYLRQYLPLPSSRSLRRWPQGINAEPGLSSQVLQVLKNKHDLNPDEFTYCCLMLDAMSIRKHIAYDKNSEIMSGYVDLGFGPEEDGPPASEALVFMLVGIRSAWKAPIAYFLVHGISAESQQQLVLHAINAVEEVGLYVTCVTMDGHASNLGMARLMGAKMDVSLTTVQPFFRITKASHPIYILLDPCHMIKLVRNTLHALGQIKSPSRLVCWSFIQNLHTIQDQIGLRLGNKLTARHVNFFQNKMKVSLATQTLLASVADAMMTLKSLGLPEYQGCDATVDFIQRVNRLFDTLNSRSPSAKGFKQPLRVCNMPQLLPFLNETRQFLLQLKTVDGTPLHLTKRHVCITGLVCAIDTILGIGKTLLETEAAKYILMYKFSQDHLELFFNAIRRCGGWNNNPSVAHFKSIYRKLLTRCDVLPGTTGNVLSLDNTELLQSSYCTYISPSASANSEISEEDTMKLPQLPDDVLESTVSNLNIVRGNILLYICGWIVRKLLQKITCSECRISLISDGTSHQFKKFSNLIAIKNNGGLIFPSDGVFKIVTTADSCLRQNPKAKYLHIQMSIMRKIADHDIFNLGEHVYETMDGIENHHLSMVKMTIKTYFDLYQFQQCKVLNLRLHGDNIRHKSNKAILFKGQ